MSRESRARAVVQFFIDRPIPYKQAFKVYKEQRQWRLVKRVFDGKNQYTEADLKEWERIIKIIRKDEQTIRKADS